MLTMLEIRWRQQASFEHNQSCRLTCFWMKSEKLYNLILILFSFQLRWRTSSSSVSFIFCPSFPQRMKIHPYSLSSRTWLSSSLYLCCLPWLPWSIEELQFIFTCLTILKHDSLIHPGFLLSEEAGLLDLKIDVRTSGDSINLRSSLCPSFSNSWSFLYRVTSSPAESLP